LNAVFRSGSAPSTELYENPECLHTRLTAGDACQRRLATFSAGCVRWQPSERLRLSYLRRTQPERRSAVQVDSEIIERHPRSINRASACLRDLGQHRSNDLPSVSTVLGAPHDIASATPFVCELNASVDPTVAFSNETFSFSRRCLILLHSEMRLESLSKSYPPSYRIEL
jgi:hypothetical protein